jgi:hypothetical protein
MSDRRTIAIAAGAACALLGAFGVAALGFALLAVRVADSNRGPKPMQYAVPARGEVEAFAPVLEAAFLAGGGAAMQLIDVEAMAQRRMPQGLSAAERRGVLRGVQMASRDFALVRTIETELARGGVYQYRVTAERDGRPVARFRLLPAAGGVSFHDYVVGRSAAGDLRVLDVFTMVSGEYLSESMNGLLAATLGDRDLLARVLGGRSEFVSDLPQLQRMAELVEAGNAEGALALYDSLSEPARHERTFFLLRVRAASLLGDDARYLAVLADLEATFPGDPGANANLLDAYFLRRDWIRCQRALAALSSEFRDSYWDVLRARALLGAGDLAAARAAADRVVASEPDLIDGHDVVLAVSLASSDLARANEALEVLVARFAVDPSVLAAQPGYERVVELPAYRAAAQASQPTPQ